MTTTLKHTPLFAAHVALGGRIVPFAGWEMPLQFQGILAESRAVRARCGLFDVSHMGRIVVEGPGAGPLLDWAHSNDIAGMAVGRARYGLLCNPEGGVIDDGIVYRLGEQRYLLVANAANMERVLSWVRRWRQERSPDAEITDVTLEQAMIAFQGPEAVGIMERLSSFDSSRVRPFWCMEADIQGRHALVGRTGYTGEDGVEVILPSEHAPWLWSLLQEQGATPCGLGARDVLRLEAALLLHGQDMDATTNPVEAGLERFVKADKEFCGGDAIRRAQKHGVSRKLVGFQTDGRGAVPRHGYAILDGGSAIGKVTSGGFSPTLDRNIGLGYVSPRHATPGARFQVDVRGRPTEAVAVPLPFYSRKR
ncbi:MAG: glycine cleavage system aminomethyltransferase GcvT [Chloroflexi bacterium]|nr:glycine cleavage system aminomethyltransferase GcvT [Chloroflexota bacterium]